MGSVAQRRGWLLAAWLAVAAGGLSASAAEPSGSSLVPITPCRLVDTRPAPLQVGTRATPLGAGETTTFQVTGAVGACAVPATATAIVANVTIANPTAPGYLSLYPADHTWPGTANLTWTAGAAPTPNQVTVALSPSGAVAAYNFAGTVDVVVDVFGYYLPGAAGSVGPPGPPGPTGLTGPTGPAGPQGTSGVVSVSSLHGQIDPVTHNAGTVVPFGPTKSVTLDQEHTVMVVGQVPLGTSGSGVHVAVDPCYRTLLSSTYTTFNTVNSYGLVEFPTGITQIIPFSGTVVLPAGAYLVSQCLIGGATATFDQNDYINSTILVLQ